MFTFCELEPMDYWEIQTLAKCVCEFLVYWAAYAAKNMENCRPHPPTLTENSVIFFNPSLIQPSCKISNMI